MKKSKILILLLVLFYAVTTNGQIALDTTLSVTTTPRVNIAATASWVINGTNTYSVTVNKVKLKDKCTYSMYFTNGNTTSSSLAFTSGTTTTTITFKKWSSGSLVNLANGDISPGQVLKFTYNGTYLILEGGTGGGGGGSGTVESVTGAGVNNTDPNNPVISFPISSEVQFTSTVAIAATNVQAAIEEVDAEKQPIDSDLTTIAGLSPSNDDIIQRKAGAWTNRTLAQILADLFPSKTQNTFYAAPNGSSGVPTFRAIVAADIPTLNQNTTGNAATVTTIPTLSGDVNNSGNAITVTKINGTALSALGTGLLKNTTSTGVPSIAVSGTDIKTINGSSILGSGNIALGVGVFVTPEDYGAVGDGSTNDQAAIQSAVSSGKPVLFAQKNYRVNSTVSVPSNAYLFGYGVTSIISTTSNISVFTIAGKNILIRDIKIIGNSTGAVQRGIDITGDAGFTLDYTQNRLENVYFEALLHAGLYVERVGTQSTVIHTGAVTGINCYAYNCGTGFYLGVRAEYNNLIGCWANSCTVQGLLICGGNNTWLGGQLTDNLLGINVEKLSGEGNDAHGVVDGAKINHNTTAIKGVSILNGFIFANNLIYNTGSLNLVGCTGIKFINNTFGGTTAIIVNNCPNTEFNYNTFYNTPTATITTTTPLWVGNSFVQSAVNPSFINNTTPGIQRSSVTTQFDATSNTTLANITGLSGSLAAGKRYSFKATLYTSSNIAGGIKAAVAGTATATSIIYEALVFQTGVQIVPGTTRAAALATTAGDVTAVTVARVDIEGTIVCNAAGTLTIQFAQNVSNGSASSVLVGSTFIINELL